MVVGGGGKGAVLWSELEQGANLPCIRELGNCHWSCRYYVLTMYHPILDFIFLRFYV